MTKKDLFRLIIKIFGLYSIISIVFSALPHNFSWAIREFDLTSIIWVSSTLIIIVALFVFMIYRTDTIVAWLKLDRGFDNDNIDFKNFNSENILKLAIIIIGGIFLLKNVPAFLSHTLFAFKSSFTNELTDSIFKYTSLNQYIAWATSFLNVVIGYLLLTNYSYVSRILKKKNDKNEDIRAGK